MPELHISPTAKETARDAATFVALLAEKRVREDGRFAISLSGGSTPRRLYQLLASPAYAEGMAWDRWHIFWGDERCVPPEHTDSNYRLAKETLLDRAPIPPESIHRIQAELAPETAAAEYEQQLLNVFGASRPVFDLILLGMGDDGHTASLFPGTDALGEQSRLVVANWVPHLDAHRITFTLPLINAASTVAFLVTERTKAGMLKEVLEPVPERPLPPAALVSPNSGAVHWFLTRGAASQLREIGY